VGASLLKPANSLGLRGCERAWRSSLPSSRDSRDRSGSSWELRGAGSTPYGCLEGLVEEIQLAHPRSVHTWARLSWSP
jgi:hypothetical protein